jgi:hypothetical protein
LGGSDLAGKGSGLELPCPVAHLNGVSDAAALILRAGRMEPWRLRV